jgi:hypothetical protein
MSEKPYVTDPLELPEPEVEFSRADLIFFGVDHSGRSFQARVFVNNPDANADTARAEEEGYVGAFHIFGHGGCFGDVGHCDLPTSPQEQTDLRLPHPLTPATKGIVVTDALRRLLDAGLREVTLTVVPIVHETTLPLGRAATEGPTLQFQSVSLVTYQ